ncbi:hypothetical protein MMC12_000373 [Toensbergia leucococca]|nr:hypothetical protein [Toensbergia leucococca]
MGGGKLRSARRRNMRNPTEVIDVDALDLDTKDLIRGPQASLLPLFEAEWPAGIVTDKKG